MKLTLQIQLLPTAEQATALHLATMTDIGRTIDQPFDDVLACFRLIADGGSVGFGELKFE